MRVSALDYNQWCNHNRLGRKPDAAMLVNPLQVLYRLRAEVSETRELAAAN